MRILYLSSWFPIPPDNGSRQRAYYLLRGLASKHQVSLVALTDTDQQPPDLNALREFCVDVHTLPRPWFRPSRGKALVGLFSLRPRFLVDTYDSVMAHLIQELVARDSFDAILAGELSMATYAANIPHPRKIFDDVEVGLFADAYKNARGAKRVRNGLTWFKHARYIQQIAHRFDALTVVSPLERAHVQALGITSEKIHVVPNGVDCAAADSIRASRESCTLIYNGAVTFEANRDAVYYFVRDMLPRLREQEPRVRLRITGRADQVAENDLSDDNIVSFTGYVPDVRPLVRASAVCVVPLRIGGGTRLKILEAMALRTPVVSTSKGAEGLNLQHQEQLLIADTPAEFVRAILQLLHDDALRERLTTAAYARVRTEYDWSMIAQRLDALL